MKKVCHVLSVMLLVTPTLARAQEQTERIGTKHKTWLTSNFRTGLSECTIAPLKQGFAVSGAGVASFEDSDGAGLDFSIAAAAGVAPTVTALAIKTKGTGAQRKRAVDQTCPAAPSPDGGTSKGASSACAVIGNPDAPEVRFWVPLAAFGDAGSGKSYVGTVTIVKRAADAAAVRFLSKKGYDLYQAQGGRATGGSAAQPIEMTVVAACDTSELSAKAGQPVAHYDLAVGKKV